MSDDSYNSGRERYEEEFTPCEECGEGVDIGGSGTYWKTSDERFWHDECYEPFQKVERAEELQKEILSLMVPESYYDGLSDDFHNSLDAAQAAIYDGVRRERLRRKQGLGPYNTDTERSGGDTA